MVSKIHVGLVSAIGVIFLFTGIAFGKSKQITVAYPAIVGRSLRLTPGNYRIHVTGNTKTSEVQFYNRYGHLVGQAPARVVSESTKNGRTEIHYNELASNRQLLTEISPGGWRENLVFSDPSTNEKTAKP
jgi:hypothetical protein